MRKKTISAFSFPFHISVSVKYYMLQCPRKTLFCWSHCSSIKVSPFSLSWINGRMEGGMKRSNEWTIVLLLQTGHSVKFLRGQSLFKVASYTTSYLCVFLSVCVHACMHVVLWVSIRFSQADISLHAEKKKSANSECLYECMRLCWLDQVKEVPTSLPVQMEGQQLMAMGVLCSKCLAIQARLRHKMHDSLIVLSKMDGSWKKNATRWMHCDFLNNTNTCHQTPVGIQAM